MPDHVHLLLSEPQLDSAPHKQLEGGPFKPGFGLSGDVQQLPTLADAIKSLKQGVARRLIGNAEHFWQKRYYDFNIRNYAQFVEKLRYIHCNPVRAGLCERPEDWPWSSFLHYAIGAEGRVEIESEWTARKRERAKTLSSYRTAPLKPKPGLNGPPVPLLRTRGIGMAHSSADQGLLPCLFFHSLAGVYCAHDFNFSLQGAVIMSLRAVEEVSTQVPADDFQALEDKVYRTIELYKSAREARATAERDVQRLRAQLEEREEEVQSMRREMVALRKEREEIRGRVEKMLAQIDRMAEEPAAS